MTPTSKRERPLSPFLFGYRGLLYRWQYTMALSILHRAMGVALSTGLLLFAYWLFALASGREAYAEALRVFAHPLTKLALAGFSFAFFYHLLNGVRHLTWDTGHGLERKSARMSGWIAFLGSIAATVFFWWLLLSRIAGVSP